MKSMILCVLIALAFVACEGSTAADPGARISGDPLPGTVAEAGICPPCQKQECPTQLDTITAEFTDARGAFIWVTLRGATAVQADQLRSAFGMPTREEAEKVARTYLPREGFDPKVFSCKRVGVANVWPYRDPNGRFRYGTTSYDNLYIPVIEGDDKMIKSVIEDDSGRLAVVYFRADELVSSPDKAADSEGYYKLMEGDVTLDQLVLVPGACHKEIFNDRLAGLKRERELEEAAGKEVDGSDYPVIPE